MTAPEGRHRPVEEIADDVNRLIDLAHRKDTDGLMGVIEPYFVATDWCCLFAVAGGLLSRTAKSLPPAPKGARYGLAGNVPEESVELRWGRMLLAYLEDDIPRAADLFGEAIRQETIGELMACGVTTAARVDRRARAGMN